MRSFNGRVPTGFFAPKLDDCGSTTENRPSLWVCCDTVGQVDDGKSSFSMGLLRRGRMRTDDLVSVQFDPRVCWTKKAAQRFSAIGRLGNRCGMRQDDGIRERSRHETFHMHMREQPGRHFSCVWAAAGLSNNWD